MKNGQKLYYKKTCQKKYIKYIMPFSSEQMNYLTSPFASTSTVIPPSPPSYQRPTVILDSSSDEDVMDLTRSIIPLEDSSGGDFTESEGEGSNENELENLVEFPSTAGM